MTVLLSTGESVPLAELHRDRPVALVFLRHLGCVFCKQHVMELRAHPEANLVFVSMEGAEQLEKFREEMRSLHRFLSDPGRELYRHFGMEIANLGQVFNPRVFLRATKAVFAGHMASRPSSDPMQLGGTIVLGREGEILFAHRSLDASDNASAEVILGHLG